jgi:hypothetical protein
MCFLKYSGWRRVMETVETINLVDEYNKLKTENERLLEALKPFAKLAAMFDHDVDDSWGIACESTGPIRIRDLRRARDAIAAAEKGA